MSRLIVSHLLPFPFAPTLTLDADSDSTSFRISLMVDGDRMTSFNGMSWAKQKSRSMKNRESSEIPARSAARQKDRIHSRCTNVTVKEAGRFFRFPSGRVHSGSSGLSAPSCSFSSSSSEISSEETVAFSLCRM